MLDPSNHSCKIYEVTTDAANVTEGAVVATGTLHDLNHTFMELVGKNPHPDKQTYVLVDAHGVPVCGAGTK